MSGSEHRNGDGVGPVQVTHVALAMDVDRGEEWHLCRSSADGAHCHAEVVSGWVVELWEAA